MKIALLILVICLWTGMGFLVGRYKYLQPQKVEVKAGPDCKAMTTAETDKWYGMGFHDGIEAEQAWTREFRSPRPAHPAKVKPWKKCTCKNRGVDWCLEADQRQEKVKREKRDAIIQCGEINNPCQWKNVTHEGEIVFSPYDGKRAQAGECFKLNATMTLFRIECPADPTPPAVGVLVP
jgi:hypothetical protein